MNQPQPERENTEFNPLPLFIFLGFFALMLALLLAGTPKAEHTEIGFVPTVQPTIAPPTATPRPATATPEAVAASYAPEQVQRGRDVFLGTCAACHGQNAEGIQGIGKNLITSTFVGGLTDQELVAFIIVGRQPSDPLNTTGIPMPARGGNPSLTDDQLHDVVAYIRDARTASTQVVSAEPQTGAAEPAIELQPFQLPGVVAAAADYAGRGEVNFRAYYTSAEAYGLSCAGCHGVDGRGVDGLGSNLFESDLWGDGAAIFTFLTRNEPPSDPTIGFQHPVQSASYPILTDEELLQLIGYLYTLDD